jgi:hypothetical protein
MTKVFLMVVISYTNQPSITYRAITKTVEDCYAEGAMLAKQAPPEGDNVVKYFIGCSFEEPASWTPL